MPVGVLRRYVPRFLADNKAQFIAKTELGAGREVERLVVAQQRVHRPYPHGRNARHDVLVGVNAHLPAPNDHGVTVQHVAQRRVGNGSPQPGGLRRHQRRRRQDAVPALRQQPHRLHQITQHRQRGRPSRQQQPQRQ